MPKPTVPRELPFVDESILEFGPKEEADLVEQVEIDYAAELDRREAEIKGVSEEDEEIQMPEDMPYYAAMIPWYVIYRSWTKAARRVGLETDKSTIGRASALFEKYQPFWISQAAEIMERGTLSARVDPADIPLALEQSMAEWARFMRRARRLRNLTTPALEKSLLELKLDDGVLNYIVNATKFIKQAKEENTKDVTNTAIEFAG